MSIDKNPSDDDIRAQLERILKHSEFKASDKQRQFLSFVIKETLAGKSSQIKAYTIALSVYGRTETFDPQVDPIVRVEAGRLRRSLEHYYLTAGRNDPVRIVIPKGTYIPTFHSVPMQQPKAKTLAAKSTENSLSAEPTIAVMPLVCLDKDNDQEYFADGLTEELTSEVARYQDIHVIASQSTMRFKGQNIDPKKIGKELGVRYLLTGSVRTDLKTVKITIRLLDTFTGEQIWEKGTMKNKTAVDIIAVQEKIAYTVVGVIADHYGLIKRRLSKESRKKSPANLKAYDAVFRFYHYESVLTPEVFNLALTSLEHAIEIDPDYGLAYAMIGHLHADNYALGFKEVEAPLEKALTYALKGASLDPQNQFASDALTLVYFHLNNKEAFLQKVKETIALNPNAPYIVGVAGWHMALFGEWDDGLALLEKGMKLNPYYPSWFHLAPYMNFYRNGEYEAAYGEALKFNIPGLFWDPLTRAAALSRMGKKADAGIAIDTLLELEPDFAQKGRSLIGRYLKKAELVGDIIKGLRKAGLTELE